MILTHAWRSWRNSKGVALLAALALAAGIGSATAIYTVVNGVMLKPLPYRDGDRFAVLLAFSLDAPEQNVLCRTAVAPAQEIASKVQDTVREWIGDAEQHDDLTFIVMALKQSAVPSNPDVTVPPKPKFTLSYKKPRR